MTNNTRLCLCPVVQRRRDGKAFPCKMLEAEVSQLPCKKLDARGGQGPKDVSPAPAETTAQVSPRDRLPSGCQELKVKFNAGELHA